MKTRYDKATDSLYVEVRTFPSCRTVEIEQDIMLDIGDDDQPVGYDIRHASTKSEFIARRLECDEDKDRFERKLGENRKGRPKKLS